MFGDISEAASQPGPSDFVQLLIQSLQLGRYTEEAIVVPSLLVPSDSLQGAGKRVKIEDLVLEWFLKNDLDGDRTRMDLYGYPGLFRKLYQYPPWTEVEMEESVSGVSEERAHELQSLYLHCLEYGEKLLETYREYLDLEEEQIPEAVRFLGKAYIDESKKSKLLDLEREISLVRVLGLEAFESLYHAILTDYDEFRTVDGLPDLFLWHPNPTYHLWFFAEVKGPKDRLRESQAAWMRSFCKNIQGRVMIVHVV